MFKEPTLQLEWQLQRTEKERERREEIDMRDISKDYFTELGNSLDRVEKGG